MRKKGENSVKRAGKSAIPPDKIMISPLISKVNPSNFVDFAALRDSHQPGQRLPVPRMRSASARADCNC
jgi:hypothetical protein